MNNFNPISNPDTSVIWITNFCGGIRKFLTEEDARKHAESLERLSGIHCHIEKMYVRKTT